MPEKNRSMNRSLRRRWLHIGLPVLFWVLLAGYQLRMALLNFNMLPALLALESGLIAYFLLKRRAEAAFVPWTKKAVAWLSVGLPLLFQTGEANAWGMVFAFSGLLFALWGLKSLGRSFGIAPGDRGLVAIGPYRFIRHPMYAGALLVAVGALANHLSIWNVTVIGLTVASAVIRILWEEQTIQGYRLYAQVVPWRLVPGVW